MKKLSRSAGFYVVLALLVLVAASKVEPETEDGGQTMSHTNDDYRRVLAEGRHAKACFAAAQEQAVRLAGAVDSLRDNLEKAHAESAALKRLRDELIELNDRLKVEKNECVTNDVNARFQFEGRARRIERSLRSITDCAEVALGAMPSGSNRFDLWAAIQNAKEALQ